MYVCWETDRESFSCQLHPQAQAICSRRFDLDACERFLPQVHPRKPCYDFSFLQAIRFIKLSAATLLHGRLGYCDVIVARQGGEEGGREKQRGSEEGTERESGRAFVSMVRSRAITLYIYIYMYVYIIHVIYLSISVSLYIYIYIYMILLLVLVLFIRESRRLGERGGGEAEEWRQPIMFPH